MALIYPDVENIVNNYHYTLLDDGSHNVLSVNVGNNRLVYKQFMDEQVHIRKKITGFLRKLEAPLKEYFTKKFTFFDYREQSMSKERFDIESKILGEWKKREIPCMHILERHEKSLVYNHLNAINMHKVLDRSDYQGHQYQQMLDVISSIRKAAKSENDSSLFHPDMLPKNFLYIFDKNITIAIDPGLKLKNKTLEELDSKINLIFIYDLNTYENSTRYIDEFLNILDKNETKYLREINVPVTQDAMAYFRTKAFIVDLLKGTSNRGFFEYYSPKNTNRINKIIDRHL